MNALILWTLITVTYGGEVGHSKGYESKHLCAEARSLALTEMTIEANKAADDARAAMRKERAEAFTKDHPPRKTIARDVKACYDWRKEGLMLFGMACSPTCTYCAMEHDGLTHFYEAPDSGGIYNEPSPGAIKFAECVLDYATPEKP